MANKIKRYSSTIPQDKGYMKFDPVGWWVRNVDHEAAVEKKQQQIKELEDEVAEQNAIIKNGFRNNKYDFRCGQGNNRCNCERQEDCGYIEMSKQWELLNKH